MASAAKKGQAPSKLLMPKATAVWLIENTMLTFKQIAAFTDLTEIEIEALANEDIGRGLVGRDPIDHNELTQEELDRCQADENAQLVLSKSDLPTVKQRSKGPRYTPVSKRGDKPNAISYILKNNPEISDAQIVKLVGTTKPTINAIRERTHADMSTIRPQHPAELGLCTYQEYEASSDKGLKAQGKDPEQVKAERAQQAQAEMAKPQEDESSSSESGSGGFDFSNFMPDLGNTSSDSND